MSRVRIDVDELLRLRNALRRVGNAQLAIAGKLRRLESDLVGQLLVGLPAGPREGRQVRAVHWLVERLRHISLRLEFVVSSSYGRLANEVGEQLVELANQAAPASFDAPYPWSRWAHVVATSAVGAWFGGSLADWLARGARPPLVVASPAVPRGEALATRPTIADLFARLNTLLPGQVEVTPVTSSPDGVVRYVVLIRGVGRGNDTPNNLGDAALASRLPESSHSLGVLAAMAKAGVPAGAEVMVVGHSQGGITAMNLAASGAVNSLREPAGRFRVTHVLAAGSPTGNKPIPPGTTALVMENTSDIVPDLDGREEWSRLGRSVYRFDRGSGSYDEAHGVVTGYLPELSSRRFLTDPRVERYLASAEPYLAASAAPQRFDLRYASTPPRFAREGGKSW